MARWRVRQTFVYLAGRMQRYGSGTVFEAKEEEVKGQRHKLDRLDDDEKPEPPARAEPTRYRGRGRPRSTDRMIKEPPETTAM